MSPINTCYEAGFQQSRYPSKNLDSIYYSGFMQYVASGLVLGAKHQHRTSAPHKGRRYIAIETALAKEIKCVIMHKCNNLLTHDDY